MSARGSVFPHSVAKQWLCWRPPGSLPAMTLNGFQGHGACQKSDILPGGQQDLSAALRVWTTLRVSWQEPRRTFSIRKTRSPPPG